MTKSPRPEPTPATQPARSDPFAHRGDSHWGRGGRFVIDPKSGQRVPAPAETTAAPAGPDSSGQAAADKE